MKFKKMWDLKLKAIPPYNFELTVHKPAGWSWLTEDEIFENGVIWTGMRLSSKKIIGLKLRSIGSVQKPRILCDVFFDRKLTKEEKKEILNKVSRTLNVNEDIGEFYTLAKKDPILKEVVEDLYGMRRSHRVELFPSLILATTLQMAPVKRSEQMMSLLMRHYGDSITFDSKTIRLWPTPERIAKISVKELEEKCKLGYRAKNLKAIAETLCEEFPTIEELERMLPEEAKTKLMELRGIGEYSVGIVSLHPSFPVDIWSAKIFHVLFFRKKPKSPRDVISKVVKTAEKRWDKWKGYAFIYVLNDLKNLSKRFGVDFTTF